MSHSGLTLLNNGNKLIIIQIKGELDMYEKNIYLKSLKQQLSVEYSCSPGDFEKHYNIVTECSNSEGRRIYSAGAPFLQMATLGGNAVITADISMHEWLKEFVKGKEGRSLFEYENLREIDRELSKYDKKLRSPYHMFLPDGNYTEPENLGLSIRWYKQDKLQQFYGSTEWKNALCSRFIPERPDMLAVTALDGDEILAMAGCSADTGEMWQIGVDVVEYCRGKGPATWLVTLLKIEIIKRGKIPFYGTSLSILYSWNTALKSGFFPAWVETVTVEKS